MPKVINTEKIPIHIWLNRLDDTTMLQARNLANLPFAFHHVAIMPDAHLGYGMPIGTILATEDVVIPNAVGVDIGCGMCAIKTDLVSIHASELKAIMNSVRKAVPLGFKHHKKPAPHSHMPDPREAGKQIRMMIVEREYDNARTQIGPLGGGNHFIEFQMGSDGFVWFMVHTGSRNLGFQVADHYNKAAVNLNKRWKTGVPPSWQLAYLPTDSPEGISYLREMDYCVRFAENNRITICNKIKETLLDHVSPGLKFDFPINIAHNFAAHETHYGKKIYVHRKGATRAFQGEPGIIPGSQGTSSYIVTGKGNPESFSSCSHGAGRKLGRKQAIRQLDLEKEKQFLNRQGILHGIRTQKDLEEAAGAYKNIAKVMARQEDLIEVKYSLNPLAVIKG